MLNYPSVTLFIVLIVEEDLQRITMYSSIVYRVEYLSLQKKRFRFTEIAEWGKVLVTSLRPSI